MGMPGSTRWRRLWTNKVGKPVIDALAQAECEERRGKTTPLPDVPKCQAYHPLMTRYSRSNLTWPGGFFVNDSFFVLTRTWHSLRLTTHSRHPCLSGSSLGKLPGACSLRETCGLPYPLLIGCSWVGLDLREYAS